MRVTQIVFAGIVAMSVGAGLFAQEPVSNLQDLIGAKGSGGETQMEQRGYTWIRTDKSGGDAYSYWQNRHGNCISVRTSDGRYASIVHAPDFDCKGGGGQANSEHVHERKDEFQTVCGVIVDGKPIRFNCKVVDFYEGHQKTKTTLHFPDLTLRLKWQSGDQVDVHSEGMNVQPSRYWVSEGETNFTVSGKRYFYISDPNEASRELGTYAD